MVGLPKAYPTHIFCNNIMRKRYKFRNSEYIQAEFTINLNVNKHFWFKVGNGSNQYPSVLLKFVQNIFFANNFACLLL